MISSFPLRTTIVSALRRELFIYNASNNGQKAFNGVIPDPAAGTNGIPINSGIFCDPQLGCSNQLMLEDLSEEHAWQLNQEFRIASNFSGPFNFSAGGNYLHYETEENYYVFGNIFTLLAGGFNPALGFELRTTMLACRSGTSLTIRPSRLPSAPRIRTRTRFRTLTVMATTIL